MARATTAQQLVAYHRELIGGGIPSDSVRELLLEAARDLLGAEGLVVNLHTTVGGDLLRVTTEPAPGVGVSESRD